MPSLTFLPPLGVTCVGSYGMLAFLSSLLGKTVISEKCSMIGQQWLVSKIRMMIIMALSRNQMDLLYFLRFSMPHLSSTPINNVSVSTVVSNHLITPYLLFPNVDETYTLKSGFPASHWCDWWCELKALGINDLGNQIRPMENKRGTSKRGTLPIFCL